MIIGFDGKRAVSNMTGLGNYSRLVIEEVGKRFETIERNQKDKHSNKVINKYRNNNSKSDIDYAIDHNGGVRDLKKVSSEQERPSNGKSQFNGLRVTRAEDLKAKDWHCLVYTPEMKNNARLEPIRRLENVEFRFPPSTGFSGSLWRTFGVSNSLKADGCDIYHGLSNELPLNIKSAGVKSIVTIHDVIYRRLPHCYHLTDRLIYDYKYGKSCKNADKIIAVSECTKRDIMHYYDIPEEKIDVIYQGCSDIFRNTASKEELDDVRSRLNLPGRYIIQVGTVEERKNLELTIRALSTLPMDVHLVVVGGDHHGYMPKMKKLAAELSVSGRVHFLNKVTFGDLPLLYSLAEVATYPSRYEGFGIPILESLERGTPVVAATGSCLEEAGGEGALYVDPDNVEEMSGALRAILNDADKRGSMKMAGLAHARRFDNSRMADRIIDVYRDLIL